MTTIAATPACLRRVIMTVTSSPACTSALSNRLSSTMNAASGGMAASVSGRSAAHASGALRPQVAKCAGARLLTGLTHAAAAVLHQGDSVRDRRQPLERGKGCSAPPRAVELYTPDPLPIMSHRLPSGSSPVTRQYCLRPRRLQEYSLQQQQQPRFKCVRDSHNAPSQRAMLWAKRTRRNLPTSTCSAGGAGFPHFP